MDYLNKLIKLGISSLFILFYLISFNLIIIKINSNNCLCFFTTTSNIIPHTKLNIDIINMNPEKINVGNLSTKPVLK